MLDLKALYPQREVFHVNELEAQKDWARTPQQPQITTSKRTSPKVGRNAPCPCGSGKKHKRCCSGK